MILTEDKKEKLVNFFKEREKVILVYIFGSQIKGKPSPLSDIDIAIFLDEKLSKSERFDLRLYLIAKVCNILGSREVDLIVLNDVPPRLYFNVLKNGQILYSRDELKRIRSEVKVMSQYLDQKFYQDRHDRILLEQIRKDGIL